jgi:hypothetical protein
VSEGRDTLLKMPRRSTKTGAKMQSVLASFNIKLIIWSKLKKHKLSLVHEYSAVVGVGT